MYRQIVLIYHITPGHCFPSPLPPYVNTLEVNLHQCVCLCMYVCVCVCVYVCVSECVCVSTSTGKLRCCKVFSICPVLFQFTCSPHPCRLGPVRMFPPPMQSWPSPHVLPNHAVLAQSTSPPIHLVSVQSICSPHPSRIGPVHMVMIAGASLFQENRTI